MQAEYTDGHDLARFRTDRDKVAGLLPVPVCTAVALGE